MTRLLLGCALLAAILPLIRWAMRTLAHGLEEDR